MFNQRNNQRGHSRSKSGLSLLSSTSNTSSLEQDQKPIWGRSKSSESITNKSSSSISNSNSTFKLPSKRRKSNIYNINGISQSLDAIPIMEDDESEAALNVPVLSMFKNGDQNLNKSNIKQQKPNNHIRKPLFKFDDSEDTSDNGTPYIDTDLEKNEIDEDFEANCIKSDIVQTDLKRKPNAIERKNKYVENEPSSEDDDASTEHEEDEEDEEPKGTIPYTHPDNGDEKSLTSSTKSKKDGFLRNVFRSRSKSTTSKKDIDLELGHDLSIEKVSSSISNSSTVKSHKLINKLFNIDGFLNGGGLTPNNNIDPREPYHGIDDERKNADYIVQQAMKGLSRLEPENHTIQLDSGTNLAESTGFDQSNDGLTNRKIMKKDSEVYIPNDLQDHEFDDLQNFDDYSIDVPSFNNGERRKRAGIGSLLMKLNNATTNGGPNLTHSPSYASSTGYSNFTSDDEFTDQATNNLKDILSVQDFETDKSETLNDFFEFDKITNNPTLNSSFDAFESKKHSLLRKVSNKPASIKNFIKNEGSHQKKRGMNHQRTRSESQKNLNIPDFYLKQQNKDQQKKKNLFKRKKENAARITVHIADLLARQRFILLLCKAFMLYGAPTHRLEEYMAMTASVLEVDGSFVYFPGTMIVSFGDVAMRTSEMRLVRCNQGLDLCKLDDVHDVYKGVVHDRLGVEDGCRILNDIISRKPKFNKWVCTFYYAFCSACVCTWGFGGSWIDIPISFGVGAVIGFFQFVVCPMNTLYSSVFEVSSSIVASFIARAIGSINGGNTFCYASIVQSSLALILPGYIILCGSLELQSRNLVAGSVRMFYAFIYSLMLSFGITLGAALYGWIDHNATSNTICTSNVSPWFRFLFVPGFTVGIALCNQASWKQLPMMVLVSGGGYVVTYFSSLHFKDVTELNATLGCFIIGLIANVYSRVHKRLLKKFKNFGFGTSMTVSLMLPGIFVQVPSGIASQGSVFVGINTANNIVSSSSSANTGNGDSSNSSLSFGLTMIQVALGISVGLYLSTIIVYPFGKKKTGLFTL